MNFEVRGTSYGVRGASYGVRGAGFNGLKNYEF
jgi:hypothetical protein